MTNKSFNKIYSDIVPKLKKMFSNKIRDRQEVEDLVQDTMLRVYSKFHTYDSSKSALNTWIYTVAFSVLSNHFKNKSRQLNAVPMHDSYDAAHHDSPENILMSEQQLEVFLLATQKINKTFFEVYWLQEFEGLTIKEISDQLDIPEGTVKSRCKRAKDYIKEKLS